MLKESYEEGVDKKAFFKATNLKKITLKGNTKFAKNSLKKTNKKLKIVVPSKKIKKAVNKQLKKAGNINATVKLKNQNNSIVSLYYKVYLVISLSFHGHQLQELCLL
ncbi:MAG: hypothetical protein K6B41_08305 [Butyrivibrio sp.]|nr:hypothetical protein [Butyrivibrio sp.]